MNVNFITRTIELSTKEMRRASVPYSPEYTSLLQIMRDLPAFSIEIKSPHRYSNNANRGLTYERMEQHITHNKPELLDEFNNLRKIYGYSRAAKWFRNRFPDACNMVHFCSRHDLAA